MLDALSGSFYGISSAHLSGLALLAAISAAGLALYKRKQLKIGANAPAEDLASLNEKNKNRPHGSECLSHIMLAPLVLCTLSR